MAYQPSVRPDFNSIANSMAQFWNAIDHLAGEALRALHRPHGHQLAYQWSIEKRCIKNCQTENVQLYVIFPPTPDNPPVAQLVARGRPWQRLELSPLVGAERDHPHRYMTTPEGKTVCSRFNTSVCDKPCPLMGALRRGMHRKGMVGPRGPNSERWRPKPAPRLLLRDADAASMVLVGRFGQSLVDSGRQYQRVSLVSERDVPSTVIQCEGRSFIGLPFQQGPDVELDALGGFRDSHRSVSRLPILSTAGRGMRREVLRVVFLISDWADKLRQICAQLCRSSLGGFSARLWSAVRLALGNMLRQWSEGLALLPLVTSAAG
eukprot:3666859-Amphidinium_carterae.5